MQPTYNQGISSNQPTTTPMEPATSPLPFNVTSNTAVHKEYYHFILEGPTPINLYVQLQDMPGESLVDMEEASNNVWVSLDWIVVDWFFNYNKRMGIGGVLPDEEVIKNIALAFWQDL